MWILRNRCAWRVILRMPIAAKAVQRALEECRRSRASLCARVARMPFRYPTSSKNSSVSRGGMPRWPQRVSSPIGHQSWDRRWLNTRVSNIFLRESCMWLPVPRRGPKNFDSWHHGSWRDSTKSSATAGCSVSRFVGLKHRRGTMDHEPFGAAASETPTADREPSCSPRRSSRSSPD